MIRTLATLSLIGAAVVVPAAGAYAVEDPLFTRQSLMDANGAAAGAGAAMLKGEVPFNEAVAKSVFQTMHAVAYSYGDYFPAGSDKGKTKASPKIWEDMAGFQAALQQFQKDIDAAVAAKPADLDSFKAAFSQVAGNCKACHDKYKISD
jgi:cytochrome c556